jgi:hypothetical protein
VAGAGGDELLLAGVLEAGRASGAQRHHRRDVLDQHLLLDPKPAAETRLDHSHPVDGQVQQAGDDPPHMERHLSAGEDDEAPVGVEVGDDDMRLERSVLGVLGLDGGLDDHGGFGEPLGDVTGAGRDHGHDVVGGIEHVEAVILVVDHRRARGEGGVDGEHRG